MVGSRVGRVAVGVLVGALGLGVLAVSESRRVDHVEQLGERFEPAAGSVDTRRARLDTAAPEMLALIDAQGPVTGHRIVIPADLPVTW